MWGMVEGSPDCWCWGIGVLKCPHEIVKSRKLYRRYGSGHIACIDDTVVARDKTFKKVFETVKENGLLGDKHLIFRFIPPEESVCVYHLCS